MDSLCMKQYSQVQLLLGQRCCHDPWDAIKDWTGWVSVVNDPLGRCAQRICKPLNRSL